jgi:hypothetical protein
MSQDLLEYLTKKMQEEIKFITEDLATGKAKDHSEYRHSCGIVRGLTIAQNIIFETKERMDKADE